MLSADFMANQNQSIVISDQPSSLQPQFMPLPRNRTEITPTPYLTLIQGVTEFVEEMERSAYRRQPREQFALQDLARRLTNSGEFEVLEHLAWQQPIPERGNPQPIYVNLNNGELQGHMAVTLGRYLHSQATLWLQPAQTEAQPSRRRLCPARPKSAHAQRRAALFRPSFVRHVGSNRQSLTTGRAASELCNLSGGPRSTATLAS